MREGLSGTAAVRRLRLSVAVVFVLGVLAGLWPYSSGKQWATVVREEMTAEVNGPSTALDVVLADGREGRFKIDFSQGPAENSDVVCVEVSESFLGGLALRLARGIDCADTDRP